MFIILALVQLAGCVAQQPYKAYEGNPVPADKEAVVEGYLGNQTGSTLSGATFRDELVMITCVDGASTRNIWVLYGNGAQYPSQIAIMPGDHRIVAEYAHSGKVAYAALKLNGIEAGHRYLIDRDSNAVAVRLWVEDEAGRQIVSAKDSERQRPNSDYMPPFPNGCAGQEQ